MIRGCREDMARHVPTAKKPVQDESPEPVSFYGLVVGVDKAASTSSVTSTVTSIRAAPSGNVVAESTEGEAARVGEARALGEGDAVTATISAVCSAERVSVAGGVPV